MKTVTGFGGKKGKTRFLAVYVEPEVHDRAHRMAAAKGLPLSAVLRVLVRKWLNGEISVGDFNV